MAAPIAIALRRQAATERMIAAAGNLAGLLRLDLPDLVPTHRDAGLQQAIQLEAIATALETVAEAVASKQATAQTGTVPPTGHRPKRS